MVRALLPPWLSSFPFMAFSSEGSSIIGDETVHRGVQSAVAREDRAPWIRDLQGCAFLEEFGILHMGVVTARVPYRFERRSLETPMLLACVSGAGGVQVNGRDFQLRAGSAAVLRAGDPCGFHAMEGAAWEVVWICFERDARMPLLAASGLKVFEVLPLFHAMECLIAECEGSGDPANLRQLLQLIERMANRYASPRPERRLFYGAWGEVERDLGADWTLESISRLAACSSEQFRRICQKEFGTSPKRHLTRLRMRQARQRLLTSCATVEAIATEVGYCDCGAFSNVFKRSTGYSPSELRKMERADPAPA